MTSERNGKKRTRTTGGKRKGNLKRARGPSKGRQINRSNVRLKGGFARTRRWVLRASPWVLSMSLWIIKLNV